MSDNELPNLDPVPEPSEELIAYVTGCGNKPNREIAGLFGVSIWTVRAAKAIQKARCKAEGAARRARRKERRRLRDEADPAAAAARRAAAAAREAARAAQQERVKALSAGWRAAFDAGRQDAIDALLRAVVEAVRGDVGWWLEAADSLWIPSVSARWGAEARTVFVNVDFPDSDEQPGPDAEPPEFCNESVMDCLNEGLAIVWEGETLFEIDLDGINCALADEPSVPLGSRDVYRARDRARHEGGA